MIPLPGFATSSPHHDVFVLVVSLALFLGLSLYQLSLPGLHYDEAREAGVNAMQLLRGLPVDPFRGAAVRVGGQAFPLMVQDYIGALNIYLVIPFLAAGGINPTALRLLPVLTAALTLILAHRLARRLAGSLAAGVTVLLLAVSPSFVFWSRQGIFVTNVTALLAVAAAGLALHVARRGRHSDWAALGITCGLGLWAKLLFIWVIGAGVAVALVVWLNRRWTKGQGGRGAEVHGRQGDAVTWRHGDTEIRPVSASRRLRVSLSPCLPVSPAPPLLCSSAHLAWLVGPMMGLAGLLVGMAPLLVFNLQTGGTLVSIFSNLDRSYYGVSNADFLHNLGRRVSQLYALLNAEHFWYLGEAIPNRLAPWLMMALLVLAFLAWIIGSPRQPGLLLPLLGGIAFVVFYVIQSSFTVSDLFITHYAAGLPFVLLVAGLAAGTVARAAGRSGAILVLTLVLTWAASDLVTDVRYHRVLAFTGGHGTHSDAIYGLAGHLIQRPDQPTVALDWGIDAPVRFLTAGRVNPIELFGYARLDAPDPDLAARLQPFLERPDTLYLFRAPEDTVFQGRRQLLEELAGRMGRRVVEEEVVRERTRRPAFVVVRIEPS